MRASTTRASAPGVLATHPLGGSSSDCERRAVSSRHPLCPNERFTYTSGMTATHTNLAAAEGALKFARVLR